MVSKVNEIAHLVVCRLFGADLVKRVYTDDEFDKPNLDPENPVEGGFLSCSGWAYGAIIIEFINGRKITLGKDKECDFVISLIDAELWKIAEEEPSSEDNGNRLSLIIDDSNGGKFIPTFSETLYAIRSALNIPSSATAIEILIAYFSSQTELVGSKIISSITRDEYIKNSMADFIQQNHRKIAVEPTP